MAGPAKQPARVALGSARVDADSADADDRHLQRALWRSRRGMLELDLLLVRFAERRYRHLAATDQRAYLELLRLDDWVIWDWLQQAWAAPASNTDHSAAGCAAPAHLARVVGLVAAASENQPQQRQPMKPMKPIKKERNV